VLQHDSDLSVDHALRRWLIATLRFGYGRHDYVGSTREDRRYLASLPMTYKLTRAVLLKGELQEVWLCSSEPNQNYAASVALSPDGPRHPLTHVAASACPIRTSPAHLQTR
jgi:hypothetical protein